jgi:hypothetical protein
MSYKDIIAQTLVDKTSTEINVHPLNEYFIIDINYETITNAIVDNLNANGYTIIMQQ